MAIDINERYKETVTKAHIKKEARARTIGNMLGGIGIYAFASLIIYTAASYIKVYNKAFPYPLAIVFCIASIAATAFVIYNIYMLCKIHNSMFIIKKDVLINIYKKTDPQHPFRDELSPRTALYMVFGTKIDFWRFRRYAQFPILRINYRWSNGYCFTKREMREIIEIGDYFYTVTLNGYNLIAVYPCKYFNLEEGLSFK